MISCGETTCANQASPPKARQFPKAVSPNEDIRSAKIAERQMRSSLSGEEFSLVKSLSDEAGTRGLLVHYETLAPGRRSSSLHYHTRKDEMILVLSGTPSASINEITTVLSAGSVIAFPAGEAFAHTLLNESGEAVIFLSIGNNPDDDETIYLSEHGQTDLKP